MTNDSTRLLGIVNWTPNHQTVYLRVQVLQYEKPPLALKIPIPTNVDRTKLTKGTVVEVEGFGKNWRLCARYALKDLYNKHCEPLVYLKKPLRAKTHAGDTVYIDSYTKGSTVKLNGRSADGVRSLHWRIDGTFYNSLGSNENDLVKVPNIKEE